MGQRVLRARSLGPLVKTRAFGMTPLKNSGCARDDADENNVCARDDADDAIAD
jgi:hypothetical protein